MWMSAYSAGVVDTKDVFTKQDLRLRGRLQYTSGYLFGRIAKSCLTAVSNHAYSSSTSTSTISDELLSSLTLHKHLLETGRPRELKRLSAETWFIQTDAWFDPEHDCVVAGIGAVLFAPDGRPMRFSLTSCRTQWCAIWNRPTRSQWFMNAIISRCVAIFGFGVM